MRWFETHGVHLRVNPNKYGIDLVGACKVEVDRKEGWSGDTFPYPTVVIGYRHVKNYEPNNFYVMVNKEYSHCIMTSFERIVRSASVKHDNKYEENQDVYNVPLYLWKKMSMENII